MTPSGANNWYDGPIAKILFNPSGKIPLNGSGKSAGSQRREARSPDERSEIRGGVSVVPDIASLIRLQTP